MSSADEYKVDLDALDKVMVKLNGVLRSMQEIKGKTTHSTYLPEGALGQEFDEQSELRTAHNTMKTFFEDGILAKLESLIDDFSQKTAKTRGAYEDREHQHSTALHGDPGNLA
jgi:hypothetical protein